MHNLAFRRVHYYYSRDGSVTVPVVLRAGERVVDLVASVDTGASYCFFERAYASELNLDVENGIRSRFRTANSTFEASGYEVEVDVLGLVTHSVVYFFVEPTIVKNVLGRGGWLNRVRLGLVDHDRAFYLDGYNDDVD